MSAFVPQQPNAPPVGPYKNLINPRQYGVTADDIRRVKKEAAEEDYSQFLTSDTVYLDYKKTNQEYVYFENLQRDNPDFLRLTLPKNTYPHRTDSAYFIFQVDARITLPKLASEEDDPLTLSELIPSSFKFWKLLTSYEISVGSNGCVITNNEQDYHYQNRIMSLITKPISKSNLTQEYAAADNIFQFLLLDNANINTASAAVSNLMWKLLKIDPSKVKQDKDADVSITVPLTFQIPLTMLHPMYNFNSIIPPGMDTTFTFHFRSLSSMGKYLFRPTPKAVTANFRTRLRIAATRSYLYIEQPRRYPEILMSLKTKEYSNDFLMEHFQRIDFTVGSGSSYLDKLTLISPGGNVPVRIDFMLFRANEPNINPDTRFVFADLSWKYVREFKFLIHFPFPYEKRILVNSPQTNDTTYIYPPSTAEGYYHSEDNFAYATYGNQHVSHGVFPQIAKMENLAKFVNAGTLYTDTEIDQVLEVEGLKKTLYPNSMLILPSDQLNQNPYPRILGDVYLSIDFLNSHTADTKYVLYCNYYYWYNITQENGKCLFLPIDDLGHRLYTADRPKK